MAKKTNSVVKKLTEEEVNDKIEAMRKVYLQFEKEAKKLISERDILISEAKKEVEKIKIKKILDKIKNLV